MMNLFAKTVCMYKIPAKLTNSIVRPISTTNVLSWDTKTWRKKRIALAKLAQEAELAEKTGQHTPETEKFIKEFSYNDMKHKKGLFRPVHSWETSVKYMESQTYKNIYGDAPVFVPYRRNYEKSFLFFARPLPRPDCLHLGIFVSNYACPICRDEYLVVDYRNLKLLKQFIIPSVGKLLDIMIVLTCQKQYLNLQVALERAKNVGYLDYGVMHRNYNYKDYYPWWDGPETKPVPTYPDDYEGMHEYPYVRHPNFREEWYPQYDFND